MTLPSVRLVAAGAGGGVGGGGGGAEDAAGVGGGGAEAVACAAATAAGSGGCSRVCAAPHRKSDFVHPCLRQTDLSSGLAWQSPSFQASFAI